MKKLFLVFTLASGLMACSQQSQQDCGFVQNSYGERISWKEDLPVKMQIHDSVSSEHRQAILAAAQKWNQISGRHLIQIVDNNTINSQTQSAKDGVNIISMSSTWEAGKESEQARTSVYWVGDQIREADIKINAQNFSFYWQSAPQTRSVNIEALVLHEMGHVLGLKHKESSGTVMQTYLASNTDRTTIGSVDLESLKCEY